MPLKKFALFLLLLFISPLPVSAADNVFSTSLTSYYTYTAAGSSAVRQDFSITNLTSQYLISNYEIIFPFQPPDDLSGYDSKGKLTFQTEKTNSGTLVRILFNDIAAGKDETLKFTLTFTGPNTSHHNNVWEISVPALTTPDNITKYTLHLTVPTEFGLLAYSSLPTGIPETDTRAKTLSYTFTDSRAATDGLSTVFGNFQTWGFRLNYQLENNSKKNSLQYILLPSDNVNQKISLNSLTPPPTNLEVSNSGNWIGAYQLKPDQKLDIEVIGQIRLTSPLSPLSSMPDSSIIMFSSPGIDPPLEHIRPLHAEIYYDIYSSSFPKISLDWQLPPQIFPGLFSDSYLLISNSGNTAVYSLPVSIKTSGVSTDMQNSIIAVIPPLSTYRLPIKVSLGLKDIFSAKIALITAGSSSITYNIPVQRFIITYGFITFIIILTFFAAAAVAYRAGSLYFQKRPKNSHLRRQSQKP
jgi:hypothetical protein